MTNRVQTLRSSVTGNLPTAGTRAPGEIWTNFADKQLGTIDSSRNAQPLVAVRYFSTSANYAIGDYVIQSGQLYRARVAITASAFTASQWTLTGGSVLVSATAPSNPTPGDMWFDSTGGQLYVFYNDGDTSQWVVAVNQNIAGGVYLPLGGGVMAGAIANGTVNAAPTTALGIASKKYVDDGDAALVATIPAAYGDNRIINGDMRIDQRNAGAGGNAPGYTVDRWNYSQTQTSKITWQRGIPGPSTIAIGFPYFLFLAVASAFTSAATDVFGIFQPIEADMVSDFAWGTANAQPATLSFWVSGNTTGTYSGCVFNYPLPATRSYPFTFTLPATGTLTKIVVPVPADAAGTWVMSGAAGALGVWFDLGSGTNFRAAPGAWVNGNYRGATGTTVNFVATAGAQISITGVKLEIGSIATPYNRQTTAQSMIDCQRYYWQPDSLHLAAGYGGAGVGVYNEYIFPVTMRATPTITPSNTTYNNASTLTFAAIGTGLYRTQLIITAAGQGYANHNIAVSAEL